MGKSRRNDDTDGFSIHTPVDWLLLPGFMGITWDYSYS